jgi:hypothetical protein
MDELGGKLTGPAPSWNPPWKIKRPRILFEIHDIEI